MSLVDRRRRPAASSRLTVDHVDVDNDDVRIRLGAEPVVLPEPLAALARQVVARMLGIHISVAVARQCASSGDRTNYAVGARASA